MLDYMHIYTGDTCCDVCIDDWKNIEKDLFKDLSMPLVNNQENYARQVS